MIDNKLFALVGPIQTGKTTIIRSILKEFRSKSNFPVYGFSEICIKTKDDRRSYDVITDINGKTEQIPFVKPLEKILPNGMQFSFSDDAIKAVYRTFTEQNYSKVPTLMYFDEFGRLEYRERGLWNSIHFMLKHFMDNKIPFVPIITCRQQNLGLFSELMAYSFNFRNKPIVHNVPLTTQQQSDFVSGLIEMMEKSK